MALGGAKDERSAGVEVVHDVEELLAPLGRREGRAQEAPDAQVERRPLRLGDERIGGLLDAIVREAVLIAGGPRDEPEDEHRLEGAQLEIGGALLRDERERLAGEGVADAGGELQHLLCLRREPAQLADHEVDDVVRVALLTDRRLVPAIAALRAAGDEPVLVERQHELDQEEGVTARLVVDQPCQRVELAGRRAERVGEELHHMGRREGAELDLAHLRVRLAKVVEQEREGVRRVDLVVAVGPEQEHGARRGGLGHEVPDEVQTGEVGPLEIIEEEHQGALPLREYTEKPLEDEAQAVLRRCGRQLGQRRLLPCHEGEARHEIDEDLPVALPGFLQARSPGRELGVGAREEVLHELTDGLGDRRVRDVALELVELAADEEALPLQHGPVQLVDHRRLADARVAADQDQLHAPRVPHAMERVEERGHRRLAAIEALRDLKPRRDVVLSERERLGPVTATALQVGAQATCALVAILGHLGHELQHDRREHGRDLRPSLVRRPRRLRDVRVEPLQRVFAGERERARQELVERDPQRVEVRAVVHGAVHAPGLLRRHVAGRPLDEVDRRRVDVLHLLEGGAAEVDDLHRARGRDQDVAGLQVPVNHAEAVDVLEDPRERDGQIEEGPDREGLARRIRQGPPAEVVEHQHRHVAAALEPVTPDHAVDAVEPPEEIVLSPVALDLAPRGGLRRGSLEDDREPVRLADGSKETAVSAHGERLHDRVSGDSKHVRFSIVRNGRTPPARSRDQPGATSACRCTHLVESDHARASTSRLWNGLGRNWSVGSPSRPFTSFQEYSE